MSHLLASLPASASAGPACGLEHEYVVDGGALDFREVLPSLGLDGGGLDPGDPMAHRGPWGGSITADGREAEIASPPTPLDAGFTGRLGWWAEQGHHRLVDVLGPDHRIEGYSTHLSFSVEGTDVAPVARTIAERFAPAIMLLLDRSSSPGLLVRPRAGRVEVCGEHARGEHLRAAAALAAGATLAAGRAVRTGSEGDLPPAVESRIEPARIRRGWYVDRQAFGTDLYSEGRRARLALRTGATTTADEHLRACWDSARAALDGVAGPGDLEVVDAFVEARSPLPSEDPATIATPADLLVADRSPFVDLGLGRRPGFTVRPVAVQWHGVAFAVDAAGQVAARHLWIPTPWLEDFLVELHAGRLDAVVGSALTTRPPRRSLSDSVAGGAPGSAAPAAYGQLGDTAKLVPSEPDPLTGSPGRGGAGGRGEKSGDAPQGRGVSGAAVAAVVAAVVVALVAVVVAVVSGGDDDTSAADPPATTESSVTTEPALTTSTVAPTTTSTATTTTSPLVPPGPLLVTATFVSSEPPGGPAAPPGPIELGTLTCSGETCTYVIELSTTGEAIVDLATGVGSGRWEIGNGGDCAGNPAFVGAIEMTARVVDDHVEGDLVFRADSIGSTPSGQPGRTCLGLVDTFTYVAAPG